MKKTSLLLIAIVGCVSFEPVPEEELFHQVVINTYRDKESGYRIANEWLVDKFVSAESVIEYQDKDEGVLKGKGVTRHQVMFTLMIEVKEDRARITFSQMRLKSSGDALVDLMVPYDRDIHNRFIQWADESIAELESRMKEPDSDW